MKVPKKRTILALSFGISLCAAFALGFAAATSEAAEVMPMQTTSKEASVFYPPELVQKARANAKKHPWAAEIQKQVVQAAQPWMKFSDDELWDLMFGNTIKRSWMVWSNGYCPACKKGVPMYSWVMEALKQPWKARCPHCGELFPKNDFYKFYRSGLDEHNIFDPKRADRTLLFNVEHPDPKDPLHMFGVDDGEGYVEGDKRWRFIGAYLIFGQWKQAVHGGIRRLAAAYAATGDKAYAHKAGVLLDRVADLYPTFDFGKEGVMYEGPPLTGYVSTWHDACEEVRELALAYDQVFDGLRGDGKLEAFLGRKAKQFKLSSPKASIQDIRRNIEDGILRDTVNNQNKIHSNYPRTDMALLIIKTVLGWPGNRDEVFSILDGIIEKATAVDGVTGEKGLAGYSTIGPRAVAEVLGQYARLDPNLLAEVLKRHRRLHDMYRFHIDTWCLEKYYPASGDTSGFVQPVPRYMGVSFTKNPGIEPSMFSFLWRLYELTGDEAFVQVLYRANGNSVDGLPYDLFAADPAAFQKAVGDVIASKGAALKVGSVNKQEWHLAILRAGEGADARALWLDYDTGGGHSHADGMNLGLFAKGLDLLPDFGYPPVNYGGWGAPRSVWYMMTAAHNTVAVDGKNQSPSAGKTTLWANGKLFQAIRASAPEVIVGKQFERTAAMIDISDRDFYVVDVFRVVGGADHAKFIYSHFGQITSQGLSLKPAEDYGHGTQMRSFACDPAPQQGWSVDWKIEDRYKLLPAGADVHLRCTDLTSGAQAFTAEAWVSLGGFNEEAWIPCVMVRRQASEGPLASTFVTIIEPYEGTSNIARIRRLPLETPEGASFSDENAAVEIQLANGPRDLFVAVDAENPLGLSPSRGSQNALVQKEWDLRLDGELCMVRRDAAGEIKRIVLCRGNSVSIGDVVLKLKRDTDFVEVSFDEGRASVVSGQPEDVQEILAGGRNVWQE
jgi:hypothetical protein